MSIQHNEREKKNEWRGWRVKTIWNTNKKCEEKSSAQCKVAAKKKKINVHLSRFTLAVRNATGSAGCFVIFASTKMLLRRSFIITNGNL